MACAPINIPESLTHLSFECPTKNIEPRKRMSKKVMDIYRAYNEAQDNKKDRIITNYSKMDDRFAKLFTFPSLKMRAEERANIHKYVADYILTTRKDIIEQRYNKGGCMKFNKKDYIEEWNENIINE